MYIESMYTFYFHSMSNGGHKVYLLHVCLNSKTSYFFLKLELTLIYLAFLKHRQRIQYISSVNMNIKYKCTHEV